MKKAVAVGIGIAVVSLLVTILGVYVLSWIGFDSDASVVGGVLIWSVMWLSGLIAGCTYLILNKDKKRGNDETGGQEG